MNRELTPEQDAILKLYSIIYSVIQSDNTPMVTKVATIQTLKHVLEHEESPFTKSNELEDMAIVMGMETNKLVERMISKERVKEGNSILNGIDFSKN